jgi:GMP synthase (glutamine-hydrolysing)
MSSVVETILVLDFGSQYTQLIARRIRETSVYSEVIPFNASMEAIRQHSPRGIILSGGPDSVYEPGAPACDRRVYDLGIPVLGVCYGMQLMAKDLGGKVVPGAEREYGARDIQAVGPSCLLEGLRRVWMSHGDRILEPPPDFQVTARSDTAMAAMENPTKKIFGIQFHPEVTHTQNGTALLRRFIFDICGCRGSWTMGSFIERAIARIKEQVGSGRAICAISGGVDSTVAATLVSKAIGDRLTGVFVDNGLLRKNEFEKVLSILRNNLHLNVRGVDAGDRFLNLLAGVTDPEKKRKIIGGEFIRVFEDEAKAMGSVDFLVQGTVYPDVIESVSVKGPSQTIKSHHNVGGLPERMHLKLIEPLRDLFKDEVRRIGAELGLPKALIGRHPFPGPGLGVRILGPVKKEYADLLRHADDIFIGELRAQGLYDKVSQAFAVFLPVKSVGVMGDERKYDYVVALRAVETVDFMTASWAKLPYEFLDHVSRRIINEVRGISRVTYDISSKPPATIEWE